MRRRSQQALDRVSVQVGRKQVRRGQVQPSVRERGVDGVVARSSEMIADRSCNRVRSARCFSGRLLMAGISAARVSRGGTSSLITRVRGGRAATRGAIRVARREDSSTRRRYAPDAHAACAGVRISAEQRVATERSSMVCQTKSWVQTRQTGDSSERSYG